MIQITICDDDFQVCSQLEDYIRRWREGCRLEVEILSTGKEFEEVLKERHYDSIFLDTVMRDRSRIELGGFIREELGNDANMIVYMLACGDEYMLDLFQSQPFHSLKKPIRPKDSQNVFRKACEKTGGDAGIFEFKSSRIACRIPLEDVLHFEDDNRRVKIVTTGHTYHCCSILENLFSKINMEQAGFTWLHRSYAVNLRYVTTFSVRMVTLFDSSEFTAGAPFKKNALRRHEGYILKTGMGSGSKSGG